MTTPTPNERFKKVVSYDKFNSDKFILLSFLFWIIWTIVISFCFIKLVPKWNTQFFPLGVFIISSWIIPCIIGIICSREVYYKKIIYKRRKKK